MVRDIRLSRRKIIISAEFPPRMDKAKVIYRWLTFLDFIPAPDIRLQGPQSQVSHHIMKPCFLLQINKTPVFYTSNWPSCLGKTYLVNQMLQRNLFETHFDKILLIYDNPQSIHDDMQRLFAAELSKNRTSERFQRYFPNKIKNNLLI